MPKSIIGGWRAFSLQVQSDIATAKTVDTLLNFEGEPMAPEAETYWVNDDEVTGELLPTNKRLLTKKFEGKHKSKAHAHIVGLFAAMAMGKDTLSGTGPFEHKLEIDKTVVELPYRTMVENDGDSQYRYPGVACTSFTLSGQRGGFVDFEADLIGSGVEAVDATAKPSRVSESYLAYGDLTFNKGGTFDGDAVTGGTDISAELKNFKLTYKNNGKGVYLFGDPSGNVGEIRRGSKYEVEFEAGIEFDDQSHRTEFLAGTEFVTELALVGAADTSIRIILPRVAYREAKKSVDDGILFLAAKLAVLSDPTHGGLVIVVSNTQSASYLAAA